MADDLTGCEQFQLDACIECGCCDLVCPSSIKLTETFRYAKSQARFRDITEQKAAAAEQRFTEREHRLEQRALARKRAIEERKQPFNPAANLIEKKLKQRWPGHEQSVSQSNPDDTDYSR